jgi:hypothetical protein
MQYSICTRGDLNVQLSWVEDMGKPIIPACLVCALVGGQWRDMDGCLVLSMAEDLLFSTDQCWEIDGSPCKNEDHS